MTKPKHARARTKKARAGSVQRIVVPPLLPDEIIYELKTQAKWLWDSYKEADGQVRKPDIRRSVSALLQAAMIVRRHNAGTELPPPDSDGGSQKGLSHGNKG